VFIAWLFITTMLVVCLTGKELRGKWPSLFTLQPSIFITLIKYSSGRLVADFFQFSLAAFPLIYISNIHGLQTTAYFSVGIFFVTMVTPIFSFMGIILLPYVSKALARSEMATANRLVNRLAITYIGTSLLFISVIYLFTELLITLLFSSDYIVTKDLTRIMILSILPQAVYMLYRNTIDAVSVIPYNAIFLGICLGVMVIGFMLSPTLTLYAWVYLAVSTLQGLLAWGAWTLLSKK
jgi:O-antigen/teichoic acid export membrane protein